jgi:hypothetical protein
MSMLAKPSLRVAVGDEAIRELDSCSLLLFFNLLLFTIFQIAAVVRRGGLPRNDKILYSTINLNISNLMPPQIPPMSDFTGKLALPGYNLATA